MLKFIDYIGIVILLLLYFDCFLFYFTTLTLFFTETFSKTPRTQSSEYSMFQELAFIVELKLL